MTRNCANVAEFTLCGCPSPAAAVFRPPYARKLRTDDSVCAGWSRAAPARLYHATRDEQAVNANTFACQAALANGAQVLVIDQNARTAATMRVRWRD